MSGFRYAEVEKALGSLHGVDERSAGAFRGRLKHFNRLGLVPSSPGRGRKITYTMEDICRWAYALEFSEFGVDPTAIKEIVDATWSLAREALVHGSGPIARPPPDDLMVVNSDFMRRTFSSSDNFRFSVMPLADIREAVADEDVQSLMVINLSRLSRRVWNTAFRLSAPPERSGGRRSTQT